MIFSPQHNVISLLMKLLLVMIELSAFAKESFRFETFVNEPVNISLGRTYPLLEIHVSGLSTGRCGILCAENPFCSMFLYDTDDQQCALFGVPNKTTSTYQISSIDNDSKMTSFVLESDCPYMYVRALGKCFKINMATQAKADAQLYCTQIKGALIETRSMEELEFLRAMLMSAPGWLAGEYWTGGENIQRKYSWASDSQVIDTRMWGTGQPDSVGAQDQSCVDLLPEFTFYLNDVDCEIKRSVICEVP